MLYIFSEVWPYLLNTFNFKVSSAVFCYWADA